MTITPGDAAKAALFVAVILAVTAAALVLLGDALGTLLRLCAAWPSDTIL